MEVQSLDVAAYFAGAFVGMIVMAAVMAYKAYEAGYFDKITVHDVLDLVLCSHVFTDPWRHPVYYAVLFLWIGVKVAEFVKRQN